MAKEVEKVFAGAGNRDAPDVYCELGYEIAKLFFENNWRLNSGAAEGMDTAFEQGCPRNDIFVPWDGYNKRKLIHKAPKMAFELAIKYHEMGARIELYRGLHALHARNAMIVLGKRLDEPVDVLVVYTRDGVTKASDVVPGEKGTGGTGTAIKLAEAFDIPVVNLKDPMSLYHLSSWTGIDFTGLKHPKV